MFLKKSQTFTLNNNFIQVFITDFIAILKQKCPFQHFDCCVCQWDAQNIFYVYSQNVCCLWTHLSKQGTQEEVQGSQWVSRNLQHHKCRTWAQAERTWGQSYTGSHRPWTDLQSPSPCIAENLPLGQQEEGRTPLNKCILLNHFIPRVL